MRGGYREGSGRSKSGYYNGIYCGSTYELCWVIYNLDHNINFNRFPGKIENNGITYFPDFLLDDNVTIVETKGYEDQSSVDKKTAVANYHGYTVIVLRKDDLKYAFDYVFQKYNTKNYYTLYDGYKPLHTYVCSNCDSSFNKDTKLKTAEVFCSRKCAGKYRKVCRIDVNTESANYTRSFTKEEALDIFNRTDKSLQGIADEYKTSKNTIWFIKQRKSYKWIHE
jgi:hypothetical protein